MFLTFLVVVFLASAASLGLLLAAPGVAAGRGMTTKGLAVVAFSSALMLIGGWLRGA